MALKNSPSPPSPPSCFGVLIIASRLKDSHKRDKAKAVANNRNCINCAPFDRLRCANGQGHGETAKTTRPTPRWQIHSWFLVSMSVARFPVSIRSQTPRLTVLLGLAPARPILIARRMRNPLALQPDVSDGLGFDVAADSLIVQIPDMDFQMAGHRISQRRAVS